MASTSLWSAHHAALQYSCYDVDVDLASFTVPPRSAPLNNNHDHHDDDDDDDDVWPLSSSSGVYSLGSTDAVQNQRLSTYQTVGASTSSSGPQHHTVLDDQRATRSPCSDARI